MIWIIEKIDSMLINSFFDRQWTSDHRYWNFITKFGAWLFKRYLTVAFKFYHIVAREL